MERKIYSFSAIKLSELKKIAPMKAVLDRTKFKDWFEEYYPFSEEEGFFLEKLIEKNILLLPSYSEEKLKMKFLSVILNKIDFANEQIQDWYDANLTAIINNVELNGYPDFMLATGEEEPEKPYFFIQEFKPSKPDRDPQAQLLAEMYVATELNQSKTMRGAYIIGQYWKFVILEKQENNAFFYYVSKSFDSLEIADLKQIYINLQNVKKTLTKMN